MLVTPDTITSEQILDLRERARTGVIPMGNIIDADIALGHRFLSYERQAARERLAATWNRHAEPLTSLLAQLAIWSAGRQFDDDQDPATDSPDERLVRAFERWGSLEGVSGR